MLRDLSGHGLAAETRRFLLSASSAWSSVRAESVADFQAAVTSFAGVPDAAESPAGTVPDDPRDWSADAFKSAIVQQLRSGQPPPSDARSLFDLLLTFMATHPVEARMFLQSLRSARDLRLSLVRALPESQFVRLLDTLCPQETQTLQAVLRTLSAIPSPYRPRPVDVRQLLLHGALRLDDGARLTSDFFAQMLRDLSGHGLAAETRRFLLSASSAWSSVRAESVADFQTAVTSFAGVPDAAASPADIEPDTTADSTSRPVTPDVAVNLRDAVFAFLLGERKLPGDRRHSGAT